MVRTPDDIVNIYENIDKAVRAYVDIEQIDGKWYVTTPHDRTLFITPDDYKVIPDDWLNSPYPEECVTNQIAKIEGGDFDWSGAYSICMNEQGMDAEEVYSLICDEIIEQNKIYVCFDE